jgi:cytochrome c oxidase subunit 3
MNVSITQRPESQHIYAQRFALWLAIASMVMMFAGLTSAYIVKKADAENWISFALPTVFLVSTGIIILSSLTMHLAMVSFKRNHLQRYKLLIGLTLLLGLVFIGLQYVGWSDLVGQGFYLAREVSSDFFYVISGAHAAHVLGGCFILLASWLGISRKLRNASNQPKEPVSESRKFRVELVATYWHFVDVLWIYLYLFLVYNNA